MPAARTQTGYERQTPCVIIWFANLISEPMASWTATGKSTEIPAAESSYQRPTATARRSTAMVVDGKWHPLLAPLF